jgi:hypothetical protein
MRCAVVANSYQVAVFDPDSPDAYPEWQSGDEDWVATDSGLAIATVTDAELVVEVKILDKDVAPPTYEGWEQVVRRRLTMGAGRLAIGNVLAATICHVEIGSPSCDVLVLRRPNSPDLHVLVYRDSR